MPKKGRSKSKSRSHPHDNSQEMCRKHNLTPLQYAEIVSCHNGSADHGRGSSRARSDGGRSGHTSRAASPSRRPPRDQFKDAVKRRYKIACDYVKGDEVLLALYSRDDLMAKAYELEKLKNHTLVVDHLQDHGPAKAPYPDEAMELFGPRTEELTYKKRSPKSVYAKKWAEALEQMHTSNYAWDDLFSKHTLRALLLQQCGDHVDQHKLTLQQYIQKHQTPSDDANKMAKELYPNDETTIMKFQYKIRRNRQYAVAGHPSAHDAHAGHLHAVPPVAGHSTQSSRPVHTTHATRMGQSEAMNAQVSKVNPVGNNRSALAADDFGDDINDDYRV